MSDDDVLELDLDGEDEFENEEIVVDEADGWKQATQADLEKYLKNKDTLIEHKIPIDEEDKVFITFWIRDLPVTEQLDMLELFMTFDKKGEAKLKWKSYYAHAYTRMVKKSEPTIRWREGRFYNKRFLNILMKYLPHPFEDKAKSVGGISEDTRKN